MVNAIPEPVLKKMRRVGTVLNAMAALSPSLAGRAAFTLFCTPRRSEFREKDLAFLATARQETFHSEGQSIRTYTWDAEKAEAPRILFLHGWESSSSRWFKYAQEALKAGFSVQMFDAPASGHSSGRMLNALIYSRVLRDYIQENGAPYAMVGHSLGGAAAVLSCTFLNAPRPQKMVLLATFSDSARVIRDYTYLLGARERIAKALFLHLERLSGLPIESYSIRKKAGELNDVEGMVIHDAADDVTPVAEGREIAVSWGCRFVETHGFGHRLQHDSVVRTVLEFLSKS